MARAARAAALAAGLAALLALAAALALAVWAERALTPERVARELGARLGSEVEIDAVALAWAPPGLRLEGLRAAPAAELARVEVTASVSGLVRGRLEPARLELESGRIALWLEDGDVRLAGSAPSAAAGGLDPASLPEIVVREVEIELSEARDGHADSVVTRITVEALDLDPLLLGDVAIRARFQLGAGRDEGSLRLSGRASPQESLHESPLSLRVEVSDLHPRHLLPRLPPRFEELTIEGRLDAVAEVEGSLREGLGIELTLALPEGRLAMGDLELAGGSGLAGRLQWRTGAPPELEGRLFAGEVAFEGRRATGVEVSLRHAGEVTQIRSLRLDTFQPAADEATVAGARFELGVAGSGRIALRESPGRQGLLLGASELEAEDVGLVLRAGERPPLHLHLTSLALRDLAEGARATGSAELALGDAGAGGQLRVEVRSEPLPADPELDTQPVELVLRGEALALSALASLAPADWALRAPSARLDAEAELAGSLASGLRGPLAATLREGDVAAGKLAIGAPGALEGHGVVTGAGVEIHEAALRAASLAWSDHRAGDARAQGSWREGILAISSLTLRSYEGTLDLAHDEAPDLALSTSGAERITLAGALHSWPFGGAGWLRVPSEATVQGLEVAIRDLARETTVPVLVVEAAWRHAGHGAAMTLSGSARVGGADGERGRVELVAELGAPRAGPPQPTALRADVAELDAALVLPWVDLGIPLGGDLGPLTGRADLGRESGGGLAGAVTVSAERGVLEVGALSLGAPLEGRGRLGLGDAPALRDGRLRAAWAELSGWRTGAVDGALAYQDGTLTASPLSVQAFGGDWTVRGRVHTTDPPSFALDVAVAGAAVERIVARGGAVPELAEPVRLDASGHVAGSFSEGPRWLDPIQGEGRLVLRGGFVPSEKVWRAITSGIMGRVPGLSNLGPSGQVQAQLEAASAPWRIREGRVEADPIEVRTSDYHFAGRGRMDASWTVSVRGDLSLTDTGLDRLLAHAPVADPVRRGLRLPAIPLRVRGPISDVAVHADVSRLPVATLRELLGLPGRALDVIRGAGETLLELPGRILPRGPQPEDDEEETAPSPD